MEPLPNNMAKSVSYDMENPSTSPSKDSMTSSVNDLQREEVLVTKGLTSCLTGSASGIHRFWDITSSVAQPSAPTRISFAFPVSQKEVLPHHNPFQSIAPDVQQKISKMSNFPGLSQRPVFGRSSFPAPQQHLIQESNTGPRPSLALKHFGAARSTGMSSEPTALSGIGVRSTGIAVRQMSDSLTSIPEHEQHFSSYIKGEVEKEEEEESKGVPSQLVTGSLFDVALGSQGNETSGARAFDGWPGVGEQIIRAYPLLGMLDPNTLTPSQVLFYFGVLTAQEKHLRPEFEFSREEHTGRWGVKLTLYGGTLLKQRLYASRIYAKLDVCREALGLLRLQYPRWIVPDEPTECLTMPEWKWAELIEDQCKQENIPPPRYTKYTHENGYRYEVELPGISTFGVRKFYRREKDAVEASAHRGLYLLLIQGLNDVNAFSGHSTLKQNDEKLLPFLPRGLSSQPTYGNQSRIIDDFPILHGAQTNAAKVRKNRKKKKNSLPANVTPPANLIPLNKSRIAPIDVPDQLGQQSKWNVSPGHLKREIGSEDTYRGQLRRVCKLLELGFPNIETTRNFSGQYCARASFPHDPFLARASAFRRFEEVRGDENGATEACCRKVVEYLLQTVEEDAIIEKENREQRDQVLNWPDQALSTLVGRAKRK